MNMYLVAVLVSFALAFAIGRNKNEEKKNGIEEGWIYLGKIAIPLYILIGCLIITLLWVFIVGDLLFGLYIDSGLALAFMLFIALLIGGIINLRITTEGFQDIDTSLFGKAKIVISILLVVILLMVYLNGSINPGGIQNPLYKDLNSNDVPGEAEEYVTDPAEIRVVSWDLASKFLERGYAEFASQFSTDKSSLLEYSNPTVVNGKFIWVNAPKYEFLKWTGGQTIPFYLYIENDAYNMTIGESKVEHRVDEEFSVHHQRVEWSNRIEQICFERYGLTYSINQVRLDIDDNWKPYWVVYLTRIDFWYGKPHLEKLLIIDAKNINSFKEYDIGSPNIPSWLEVVYNDYYVYDWADYWGTNRFGLSYQWFNKKHLYNPDDLAARFLIMNGTSYWQIPMKQKESSVLGGFIRMNTRTGETTFYNREKDSFPDISTAKEQVTKYLRSGTEGFQQLDLDEGYLYSFKMVDGSIREAYMFPLYAGFSINKFAIVDARKYTAIPVLELTIDKAVEQYTRRTFEGSETVNITWDWVNADIQNGFVNTDDDYSVVTLNINGSSNTFSVFRDDLTGGSILKPDDEWNELALAINEYNRGSAVDIWVIESGDKILDVDWEMADLVER
jgi:hypothetical protein